ncbi:hypothetical protein CEW92_16440 [Bacillaceae bacterium SAS-127]|nr:hypothetical protein CEW92_16440 [Bacillaceae bacterium SAS-127]
MVNLAKQQVGKPYVFGASGPNAFDCSGLMYYVLKQNGYVNSRLNVEGYWNSSFITKVSTPQKGDLIFFKNTYKTGPSHMGIMIDSNNFVHAANSRDGVIITSKDNSYYKSHFLGYGRLVGAEAALTIQDIKPNISLNTRLGVVRNFETTVIRKGPGASYPLNTSVGTDGYVNPKDQYVVSEYDNGWYKIGTEAWVYSEHFIYRPTTTINMALNGGNSGTISTPKQVEVAGIPVKPDISLNKQLGVIRNFERTIVRKGPGASSPINTNVGKSGYINPRDQYVVYEYKNGWYRIGTDAWVYSEHNNYRPSLDVTISN